MISRICKGLRGLHTFESGILKFPSSSWAVINQSPSSSDRGTPGSSPHFYKVLNSRPAAPGMNSKRTQAGVSGLRSFQFPAVWGMVGHNVYRVKAPKSRVTPWFLFPSSSPKPQVSIPGSSLGAGQDCWFAQPRGAIVDHVNGLIRGLHHRCSSAQQPWGWDSWVWAETDTGGCFVPRSKGMFEDPTRPGKQQQLGQELKELTSKEQALDQLIESCSLNFKHLTEDKANKRYPLRLGEGVGELGPVTYSYLSRDDVVPLCRDQLRLGFWNICFFLSQWLFLSTRLRLTFS